MHPSIRIDQVGFVATKEEVDAARKSEHQEIQLHRRDQFHKQDTPTCVRRESLEPVCGCTVLHTIQSYIKWYQLAEGRMREPDLQPEGENVAILLTIKLME